MSYSDDWAWFCDGLSLKDPKQLGDLFPAGAVHIVATMVRTLESSGGLPKGLSRLKKLAALVDKSIEEYELWLNKQGLSSRLTHRGRADYLSYYREIEHMRLIARRSAFPKLANAKSSDLFSVLAAIATLRDALTAREYGDIDSVISLTVQAANLANGLADRPAEMAAQNSAVSTVLTCQQKGGQNRHKATIPLREWLWTEVQSRHAATPYNSRAEACRNIEPDLVEKAKEFNLTETQFNPENAREWAERELKKRDFAPSASS